MATPTFNNTIVARAAAALWGVKLGKATTDAVLQQAAFQSGGLNSVINGAFDASYAGTTDAALATMIVANLGITGANAAGAEGAVAAALAAAPAGTKGAAVANLVNIFSNLTADPLWGSAATAFNARIATAVTYAQTAGTADALLVDVPAATSFNLAVLQDFLTGSAGDDVFTARIINNGNTLQSADVIDGGSGNDVLNADIGTSQAFAITAETTGVETVAIRTQANQTDSGQNNVAGIVQIDAQRMVGVNQWESSNSRADLIVEDVRILPSQITSDITIAMVETDPGHVDFGVYFDQYSLRNQTSNTSSINLRIMDTVAAAAGLDPLLNSNYGAFTFTFTPQGGAAQVVTLASQAIQDAQTYAQMAAAFQAALDVAFGPGAATATIGENFTVTDPDSRTAVTGQTIVLSANTAATFTTPAGSGWLADGTAPPQSNFYTNYTTGSSASSTLVTSKIILDDVGRGSTGGDLVVGGLSVGDTSSSLGVQRFEIEVRDNSKLETINSTNNTLREVTIQNGITSSSSHAYVATDVDAGDLTVNGVSGANGGNVTNTGAIDGQFGNNTPLPGSAAQTANNFGFSDVRLIDASTMRGNVAFSAEITSSSIAKYLNLKDIQALPAGDNVDFVYSGGTNADTLFVQIDTAVVGSRSTIVSGREDFTFTANGGTGNDNITVAVVNNAGTMAGGNQAWYTNQKLNKNIAVNGGDGDDTIRTPGAGDVVIGGGVGNDTVYADNTGLQSAAFANAASSLAATAYATASAAELAQSIAVATLADATNAGTTAAAAAALNTLNLVTPVAFPVAPITHATIAAATAAAAAAGAITLAQKIALDAAYNAETGGTITTPATLVAPAIATNVAVAGNLTAGEFAAGNALLDNIIATAKAAAATAAAADVNTVTETGLLNGTQAAVQGATLAMTGIGGTSTTVANLAALNSAIAVGATDVQVVAALLAARTTGGNGAISDAAATALFAAAVATAGTVDAGELAAANLILAPLMNTAANNNAAAADALAAAITANNTAVNAAANLAAADPVGAAVVGAAADSIAATESAAAAAAAAAAVTAFNNGTLTPLTTQAAELAALKSALAVGTTDLNFSLATTNAVNAGTILLADKTALDLAATFGAVPAVAGTLDATEKTAVDLIITALQLTNETLVAGNTLVAADLAAIAAATATASTNATAAANSGGASLTLSSRGVYVVNTANQAAVNGGYTLATNDERNLADLKSDVDNSYNLFNAKLTVNFKGLEAAVSTVASTGYKTSDLQLNQAIKDAINNDAVLNKLLVAQDGPANTLVITSLIDGVRTIAELSFTVTVPAVGALSVTDVAGAAAAYGLPVGSTEAAVLAAMTAAKTAFDAKGDYVDQLAETGAAGGNANITGAASRSTSDNTITGGAGNDVLVLGTTVGVDALTSSNDKVVYAAAFGNDTIVHFKAGVLSAGGDMLDFTALGGNILGTAFNVNKSVNVATEVAATNGTNLLVAALYADSATAQTHVYVAVDANNVGKVYQVVDAAGVAAGSVTATLAGTIDLADTLWASLTTDNFV